MTRLRRITGRPLRLLAAHKLLTFTIIAAIVGLLLQLTRHETALHWVLGTVAGIACIPLVRDMWEDFSAGSYGIDILALAAVVTAIILRQSWAAIIVVLMLLIGEILRAYVERRATVEFTALAAKLPHTGRVIRANRAVEVPLSGVRVGDKLRVDAGEMIPVDGIIISGEATVDVSNLTDGITPVAATARDTVFSGSVVAEGSLTIRATQVAVQSTYQQIVKLVKAAASSQAPLVRLTDRYGLPFTIFALALGGVMWLIGGHAVRFLEVIIVASPAALVLAAPLSIVSGMNRASRHGIIIRTAAALEHLAAAKTMAFNKTGTLTEGTAKVDDIIVFHGHTKQEVLGYAAALTADSEHSLGTAITAKAIAGKLKIAKVRHEVRSIHGVSGVAGGKRILVGRMSLMERHEVTLPPRYDFAKLKQMLAYVAVDGQLAGIITFTDNIRPEAQATLNQLKRLGIRHFMIITGDHAAAAKAVGKQLGITDITADALPAAKLHTIEAVRHRPVAFVGDGASDALVLTTADIGIAVGAHAARAASESADIVIAGDGIEKVSLVVGIAKHTLRVARQSIIVGIVLSLALMGIFATGRFLPIYGALVSEVVDIVVMLSALQARRGRVHP